MTMSRAHRRGAVTLEVVLGAAVLLTMAVGLLQIALRGCVLYHHLRATLTGWPLL